MPNTPDIDTQVQGALHQAMQGGYSMDEALEAINGGLVQAGAKPEWARAQLAKYGYQPQQQQPGFLDEFLAPYKALFQSSGGGGADATGGPVSRMAQGLVGAQVGQGKQAWDALTGQGEFQGYGPLGRASETVGHGLAALFPGIGPLAARTGENIGNKNVGATAADVLNLGIARGGAKAAGAVKGFMEDPVNYQSDVALSRALQPSKGNSKFLDNIEPTVGRIKQAAGRSAGNVDELLEDAQKGATQARQALEPYFQRAEQAGITGLYGDPVVEATRKAVAKTLTKPSQQQMAKQIIDEAQSDFGRSIPLRGWKQELENINKQEYGFYNKADEAQRASLGGVVNAVRKAQRDAMSDMLYKALSPEDGGAGPKEIQSSLSNILDVMDSAKNRRRAINREEPVSNVETARRSVNMGLHVLAVPLRAVFGNEAIPDIESGIFGKSNPLIRKAFGSVDAETKPYPKPLSPTHPMANPGGGGGGGGINPIFNGYPKLPSPPTTPRLGP